MPRFGFERVLSARSFEHPGTDGIRIAWVEEHVGVPGVAERVVQAALNPVLEPIFEADFEPCSYGSGPGGAPKDAIAEVHHCGPRGYQRVLDAHIRPFLE